MDRIFHSGRILLTSRSGSEVKVSEFEAFAVSHGRVTALGTNEEISKLRSSDTVMHDFNGKTVLPGFIETHMHVSNFGAFLTQVNCRPSAAPTIQHIQQAVRAEVAKKSPGQWILGFGWDEGRMREGHGPTREDLDAVAPDNPVFLKRTCGHMGVANSRALDISGITEETPDPPGGCLVRDGGGRLTGLVQEKAKGLIKDPPLTSAEIEDGLAKAQHELLAWGITTAHDLNTQARHFRVMSELNAAGNLNLRLRPWMWAIDGNGYCGVLDQFVAGGIVSGFGDDRLRIQGMKFMLDGSVGGLTAAVAEPYVGTDELGILIMDKAEALPPVLKAIRGGLRAAIHGIGDRAVEVATTVLEAAAKEEPQVADMRCRVEHCALPSEADLDRMSRLGAIAGSSVGFLHQMGDRYLEVLGKDRMARVYPQRTFLEHGIVSPPNSDCPVTDANPWHVISAAVTRTSETGTVLDTAQNLSLAEAIHGMTVEAAHASFEEQSLGTLTPGAHADFIVFDSNPYEVKEAQLSELRAIQTYVAGELKFQR